MLFRPFRIGVIVSRRAFSGTCHLLSHNSSLPGLKRSLLVVAPTSRAFASSASAAGKGGDMEFLLADIGEGIHECELIKWHVKVGDRIAQFDKVCDVSSDKATVEITSRYDGIIKTLHYKEKDMAKVGQPLMTIQVEGDSASSSASPSPKSAPQIAPNSQSQATPAPSTSPTPVPSFTRSGEKPLASPAVRRLVKELNLDLSQIPSSRKDNRVTKADVTYFLESKTNISTAAPAIAELVETKTLPGTPKPDTKQDFEALKEDTCVSITGLQRIMVKSMNASNEVPQFGYSDDFVMDNLIEFRSQVKTAAEQAGVKLSYLAFIIKATSLALLQYPMINAHVNQACTEVTYKACHNIGIAVDTPRGLLVPNIKNVQNKSILDIGRELNRLAALGQQGKLGTEDLTGGTFTLSNIGTIGGTYCRPLVVVPEVVIGALGKFQTLPRYNAKGKLRPTTVMQLSWSADHRVLDGATVARFSNAVKHYIENPSTMIIKTK